MGVTMYLYLLSQEANKNPGAVQACIVACRDDEMARYIHPDPKLAWMMYDNCWGQHMFDHTVPTHDSIWCHPHQVQVEFIGQAAEHLEPGVLMATR
jgi:hypothetical protein